MKKILFITSNVSYPWAGSEVLWSELAVYSAEKGHSIGICINNWNPKPAHIQKLLKMGAEVFSPRPVPPLTFVNRLKKKYLQQDPEKDYYDSIRNFKPDLVILSQGGNQDGEHWMRFCVEERLTFIIISQAAAETSWPHMYQIEGLRKGYAAAWKSFFVSRANLELTELQIARRISNAKVISNPFNVPFNNNITYPEPEGYFALAHVARHEIQAKSQDVLFEVLSYDKWKNRPLKVNLYGEGIHTEAIKDLLHIFQLHNVELKGYEKTTEIWRKNHALILPSRFEGLPLALVEAMLCGRFGIVTDVSGNTEVLKDNETGFVAAAPKPKYLDEAMERAWERRNEWKSIGENARNYIRTLVPENPVREVYKEIV